MRRDYSTWEMIAYHAYLYPPLSCAHACCLTVFKSKPKLGLMRILRIYSKLLGKASSPFLNHQLQVSQTLHSAARVKQSTWKSYDLFQKQCTFTFLLAEMNQRLIFGPLLCINERQFHTECGLSHLTTDLGLARESDHRRYSIRVPVCVCPLQASYTDCATCKWKHLPCLHLLF